MTRSAKGKGVVERSRGEKMNHYGIHRHAIGRYAIGRYAIDQWVDFARGIVGEEEAGQMLAHLRTGCADCSGMSDFTSKLTRACAGLVSSSVPERSIRLARAIFPVRLPDRPKGGNRRPIAMIFDSFLVPSTVAMRCGRSQEDQPGGSGACVFPCQGTSQGTGQELVAGGIND